LHGRQHRRGHVLAERAGPARGFGGPPGGTRRVRDNSHGPPPQHP
jgi:hypothetical protein